MSIRLCILVLLISLPSGKGSAEAFPPDTFNTAEEVFLQTRFALGSAFARKGTIGTNFLVSGTGSDALERDSKLKGGTSVEISIGGLGPKRASGAFVHFFTHRRRALFEVPGTDLGQLNVLGAIFAPQLGLVRKTGDQSHIRPYVELGAGAAWTTLEPSNPNVLPAPPTAGAGRSFNRAVTLAWSAGIGLDWHWKPQYGLFASFKRFGHQPVIPFNDSATGTEIGRIDADDSAWMWSVGVVYGY